MLWTIKPFRLWFSPVRKPLSRPPRPFRKRPPRREAPVQQEAPAAPAQQDAQTPVDAKDDSLNFDNLSPEEQAAVLAFVDRIDIHNSETVLKYGNAAQTKISPVLRQDSRGR